ncbi:sodium:solute symporter [Lacihabitans sp. CCS-44]|uniref:sodium:solute symporter family protein n=1 Tax=Lacihabitans sp. CCS-44 TaxID=2487331 RepID=UPI0020CF0676|nr:sodium:solute symporter family protein [Lacihabitans sp. CCS-44]MCP9756957.1 sodium:solute symporter [Lacihabitans sp. CCS-44]
MLLIFIGIYLFITVIVGWYSSKFVKNSQDYVLAGRKMPTFVVASGLFATWFGSETVMGASSEFLSHGLIGVIEDPFGASLCLLLIGLFFAKPLYRLKLYTFSDYFGLRFGKKVEVISAFFMIPSYFSWIAAQLIALAIILQAISGLPFVLGVILCASIVLFYTFIGGMWSISITDTIQTVLIVGGLGYLSYYFYAHSGGFDTIKTKIPKDFFRMIPKENNLNTWLLYFSAWITIGWGSIPQQDVFQRVLSAKSENTAVRGSVISAFMYLTVAFLPLSVVLFGSISHPELLKADNQMFIPELVLAHTNLFIQILFFGALISAILSTCSAAILAPATVVAENIIKPYFGKSLKDQDLLKIMRYSTIAITIIAVSMTFIKTNIYELVGEASALSLVALFVPLTAGLYWKKASKTGAILSMILGTISWLIALNIDLGVPPAVFGFIISLLAMILGSLFSKT